MLKLSVYKKIFKTGYSTISLKKQKTEKVFSVTTRADSTQSVFLNTSLHS